ncbi:MAG: hypothetical protein JWP58_2784 [Hymenobacter sp.]|nr:hypothetical protein [Hymenobacter sp.]
MKSLFTPAYFYRGLALTALLAAGSLAAQAQGVRIGAAGAPDASAILDLVSGTKGALLPRVVATTDVTSPATGLIVFQTGGTPGYYYNAGTSAAPSWVQLATTSGAAAVTASNGLTKTGQNIALGGNLSTPVTILQAGNALSFTGGNVGVGTATPSATLETNGDFRVANGTTAQTLGTGTTGNVTAGTAGLGQSFTLPTAGTITSIRLRSNTTYSTTFSLYSGSGNGSTPLVTQPINFVAGTAATVALTTPLVLGQGTYTIALAQATGIMYYSTGSDVYPGGSLYFGSNAAGGNIDLEFGVSYTTGAASSTFYVSPGGNVGVGVSNPGANLDVAGSTRLRSLAAGVVSAAADGTLSSTSAASLDATTASNGLTRTGTDVALGGTLTQATTIATGGNNLTVTGTGNVGIGTSSAPTSTLQVAGTNAVGVVMGLAGNNSGTPLTGGGYLGLSPTNGSDYYLLPNAANCVGRVYYLRNNSSSNTAYVGTSGGLIFDGGSATAASGAYGLGTSGSTKTVTAISDGTNWTFIRGGN